MSGDIKCGYEYPGYHIGPPGSVQACLQCFDLMRFVPEKINSEKYKKYPQYFFEVVIPVP
jgi:hypothetical protein